MAIRLGDIFVLLVAVLGCLVVIRGDSGEAILRLAASGRSYATTYLVPECDAEEQARRLLKKYCGERETWQVAGVLSEILARLQRYGPADWRRALNNPLIFRHGAETRNGGSYAQY